MIERVRRVSQVNPVSLGAGTAGNSHNDRSGEGSAFYTMLSQAMKPTKPAPVSETYVLDVTRATHSLFYQGQARLDNVKVLADE